MENLVGNKMERRAQNRPDIEDAEVISESGERSIDNHGEQITDPEQVFEEARKKFDEIKADAKKLSESVPEVDSYVNTAENAISAFDNIRESDEVTRKNLITKYFGVLNKAINSTSKLIEDNKDSLKENQDEKIKSEVDTAEEAESLKNEKSEVISQFNLIETKFAELKQKYNLLTEAQKPSLVKIVTAGDRVVSEFNELVKKELSEETLKDLEDKKGEMEVVVGSFGRKYGEVEGVESDVDRGEEGEIGTAENIGGSGEEKENIKEESTEVESILDFDENNLNNEFELGKDNDPKTVDVDENDLEAYGLEKDKDNLVFSTKNAGRVENIDLVDDKLSIEKREGVENINEPKERELDSYQKAKQTLFKKIEIGKDTEGEPVMVGLKEIYKQNKEQYDTKRDEFYKNRSKLSKLGDRMRSFLGFKPKELPKELQEIQDKYHRSRSEYLKRFSPALRERAKRQNKTENENTDIDINRALVNKFIVKPGQEMLAAQSEQMLSERQEQALKRVSEVMRRNKWQIRLGVVAGVGVLGAVTGGLAAGLMAASVRGGRMWVSSTLGSIASVATYEKMHRNVEKAEDNVIEMGRKAVSEFSVEDLDRLEKDILDAEREKDTALKRKKFAVVAAGISGSMAGGLAGAYYAPDSLAGMSDVVEKASDSSANVQLDSVSGDEISESVKEAMKSVRGFQEGVGGVDSTKVPDIVDNVVETSVGEPKVLIEELNVPIYSAEHPWQVHNYIENISINGADGLSTEQMNQITQFIQLKANDILSGEPHLSAEKLGTELQSLLEKRFSGESWWHESPISKIEIGNITKVGHDSYVDVDNLEKAGGSYDWTEGNEVVEDWHEQAEAGIETQANIYEVQPGDKLWTIMKDQYGDILNQVPASEHNQILAQLFSNVKGNSELLESLNLKSGNDIDRIYPDEKINIGPLGEELKRIIELGQVDDLPVKGTTGSLGVEADDPMKNVPINFAEQGRVDSGFDLPSEKASVNFAENGVDNPFTTTETSVGEKIVGGVESVGGGKEIIQFAVKAGTPPELTLRMNEFVQQTASEMLAKNPGIGTDPTAFKNAVWQAFAEEFKTELNGSNEMILAFEPKPETFQSTNIPIDNIPPPPPGTPPGVPPDFVGQASGGSQEIPPSYTEMSQEMATNGSDLEHINMATSMDDPALNQMRAEVFQNSDKFEKAVEAFAKTQEDRSIFDFNDSVFASVGNTMTIDNLNEIVNMGKVDALAYLKENNIDVSYEELKGWKDYVDTIAYDPANNPNGLLVTENTTLRNLVERDVVISSWFEKQQQNVA